MTPHFMSLEEAAQKLGVTPEELVEMRSQGEIRAFRDGASWKFKAEEVARFLSERAQGGDFEADLGLDDGLDDLIKASDLDDEDKTIAANDKTELATREDLAGGGSGSDLGLVTGGDSDLQLSSGAETGSDVLSGGSDGEGGTGSDVLGSPGGSDVLGPPGGSDVLSGSDVELKSPSGSGTGEVDLGGSDLDLGSDGLDVGEDDELDLGEEEDDDLVLGGSGPGSDVTLDTGDSGINLASPSDSGLSLEEEPLDLAGSSGSLELPEDDEGEVGLVGAGSEVKDEEFLLSPADEMGIDEEADSGSQVIALEGTEVFGEAIESEGPALLAEESVSAEGALEAFPGGAAVPLGVGLPGEMPEAPYTTWNVLSLGMVVLLLMLCGALMTDVVRNMWSWNEGFSAATSLMDAIVGALGMSK